MGKVQKGTLTMNYNLKIESKKRYDMFLKRVMENEVVWGLQIDDKWCVCESTKYHDTQVMPFWSDEAYAKQCAKKEWSHYIPTAIPLDAFLQNWLPGMDEDNLLAGVNWNVHLVGAEEEPSALALGLQSLEG